MSENITIDSIIDFSKVESKGSSTHVPPGPYVLRCTSVKEGTSQAGNPKLTFVFTIAEGPHAGGTIYYDQALLQSNLFAFKNLAKGMGFDVSGQFRITPVSKYVDRLVTGNLVDDTWQGNTRSKVANFNPVPVTTVDEVDDDTVQVDV